MAPITNVTRELLVEVPTTPSMERLTIGYYDESRGAGGTTRYLMELLRHLDQRRFRPVFFAPARASWHNDLRDLGVMIVGGAETYASTVSSAAVDDGVTRLMPQALLWSAGLTSEIRALTELFGRMPVDILHTNNAGAEPAPIAARLAGCPAVVGTWHVDPSYDLDNRRSGLRYRLLEKAAMEAQHGAIAVSAATRDAWATRCGLSPSFLNRVRVIHNGIDLRRIEARDTKAEARCFFGLPLDATIVGTVGRLDAAKGHDVLLRAVAKMGPRRCHTLLVIAGTGPEELPLRRLANDLGISGSVRFLGFIPNVASVLACLDIYAQTSRCEAFPFSVVEASGFGLPVVATNVGGVAEAIVDGVTGFVTPPIDSDILANRLAMLHQQPALRREFGEAGKARVQQRFTSAHMAERTAEFYDEIAGRKKIKAKIDEGERALSAPSFFFTRSSHRPTVSAIIPAYNAAGRIGRTLDSILSQTYRPQEICVIDDGSVDDTVDVVRKFGSHVHLICRENGGPGAARNTGVAATSGEWIALLDADDAWLPQKIEEQIEFTCAPEVGVIHSQILGEARPVAEEITFDVLWKSNMIAASSAMIRRTAFEEVGGFDENRALISVEDYNLWLRLTYAGWKVASCPREHIEYTRTPVSLSKQVDKLAKAELANLEGIGRIVGASTDRQTRKRLSLLDEYGRTLIYERSFKLARPYLSEAFKTSPSPMRLAWLLASHSPIQP